MPAQLRKAGASDAAAWNELLIAAIGEDYPDKQVYDVAWIAQELEMDCQTWVAALGSRFQASISFLPARGDLTPGIVNLGRVLARPEAYSDGSALALISQVNVLASQQQKSLVVRIFASDNAQQRLFEEAGYACVGFQPQKHLHRTRESVLFYARLHAGKALDQTTLSESLPQIVELAGRAFTNLGLPKPLIVRDGVTGYPVKSEVEIRAVSLGEFEQAQKAAASANPPVEISGHYSLKSGWLRGSEPARNGLLAQKNGAVVAGLAYAVDAVDRCVRVSDSFVTDDLSLGALMQHLLKIAQEQLSAIYVEMDVLGTAPRLLKTAEQLGFVPITYMPAFYKREPRAVDVVKLVKLHVVYSKDEVVLTTQARAIVDVIDQNFQDQKIGVAIINLLRALPFFEGLGDGELRKIARLFEQKLYRPGDKIFDKGDSGNEAYVLMRGQVNIVLEEGTAPIASLGNGQIFGELAFLDGVPRVALAIATQPSILLVVQRSAFNDLVQQEPHLGMVVMRNIAVELSNRLRKTNAAVVSATKAAR